MAILNEEPEGPDLLRQITNAKRRMIGAPTAFETAMVLVSRRGSSARYDFMDFLRETVTEVVSFEERHWKVALDAFQRFGKGRHSARLNLGDCQSYAVAKLAREPLLFVGDDFRQTDIEAAL